MALRSALGFDKNLTGFAHALQNKADAYIADRVMPPVQVVGRTGSHYLFADGFGFATPDHGIVRVSGGRFNRVIPEISQTAIYSLREYGVEAAVDDVDESIGQEDGVSLRENATARAWHTAMVERERDAAALLFSAAVITQTSALLGGARWDDAASDPRDQADLAGETILAATGVDQEDLCLCVNTETWNKLRKNAALLQYFRVSAPGMTRMTKVQAAEALGIKEVIVGKAIANSAAENLAAVNGFVWGKSALFCHIKSTPTDGEVPGTAYTFESRSRPQGQIERYREDPRAEIVLVSWFEDRAVVRANSAYLFTTVIS